MRNIKTNKPQSDFILSAKKLLEDKKQISKYLRGEITLKDLNDQGIKLSMPL